MISGGRHVTRINKRNQVTIPAAMLRDLGLGPGDDVEVEERDGTVALSKPVGARERWAAIVRAKNMPRFSNEELVQLVAEARIARREAAEADDERIRQQSS